MYFEYINVVFLYTLKNPLKVYIGKEKLSFLCTEPLHFAYLFIYSSIQITFFSAPTMF